MAEAVVEFDYDAVNGDELDLRKGAVIKNINMMEGGWWEGELDGKRGMFPDNFVKVIEKGGSAQKSAAPSSSSSSSTSSSAAKSSSMKSHGQGPVANGDVSLGSQEMGDETKVKKREGGIKKGKMRAKVTYSYSPQNDDELELIVDDMVEVIDQPEEGWWEGVIKGKLGLFPSNFVTLMDESDGPEAKSDTVSSGGNTPLEEDKPVKKVKGIGHGNIFADGMPQLRKTPKVEKDVRTQAKDESHPFALKRMSLRKKENEEKKDEEKKEDKNTSSSDAKGIFKVKVIYDYEPKNADELQLKKGEIVTVIDKDAGDSGWWKGELNGKIGVFPDNFTEEIHDEKVKKKNAHAPVPARPVSGVFRGDEHHSQSAPPPRPTRPGSVEMKKTAVTKQPSQDSIKPAPKETNVNGSRHLAGAKQVLPPPTAGRPQVSHKPTALAKPQAAAKPHDIKDTPKDSTDSGKTDPKESTFDNIKINSEKLTHLNLSRPKATPNRRPPSTIGVPAATSSSSFNTPLSPLVSPPPTTTSPPPVDRVDGPSSSSTHPSSHDDDEPKQPPPWSRDIKKSLRRPPVALPSHDKSAENGSGPPGRPKASPAQSSSSTPATDTSSGAPPRPAVAFTKTTASTNSSASSKDGASSAEVQDLKKEIKSLHETIASIKAEFKKEVKKLMTEVDEEKKHRMMMQVELERIKKLVMEGD